MLRLTTALCTYFQNPGLPRVLNRITPSRLELTLTLLKERKKKIRYLGSYFTHYNDRTYLYNGRGGVRKGTRFIIERHHTRTQFVHPGQPYGRYDVRAIKVAGAQYDQIGNFTRTTWDCMLATTNLQDSAFRKQFRCIEKQEAISLMEEWGVRYVLLDEMRKPSLMDCKYHRHQIYAHKFAWSPDPDTNSVTGDADYKWKGNEQIEYKDYGAGSSHPRNEFRSLWHSVTTPQKPTKASADKAAI